MNEGYHKPSEPNPPDSSLPAVIGSGHLRPTVPRLSPEMQPESDGREVLLPAAGRQDSLPDDDHTAVVPAFGTQTVIEIRVHGVSGTPPQDVLCSQWAGQVAGDKQAPIFQPVDQFGSTTLGPDLEFDGCRFTRQTESYHWGEMTSGGWRKAIWAILLPFALINVSQWMLPPEKDSEGNRIQLWPIKAILRLSGLLLTCLFMAQAAVLVMDVIVVQCSSMPGKCLSSVKLGWLWTHHRLLSILGALVLIALLAIIDQTALVRWKSVYSDKGNDNTTRAPAANPNGMIGLIEDASFYEGDVDAPWLRVVHLTGGLSVVVVLLLGGFHPQPGWWQIIWVAAVVSLAGCGLASLLLSNPRRPRPDRQSAKALMWVVPCIPLGMLILTSAAGPTASAATGQSAPLPGSDDMVGLAMIALSVITLIFAVMLITVRVTRKVPDMPGAYKPFILGLFAIPVAALGSILGAGLGVGYTELVATCLTSKCNPNAFVHVEASAAPLKLPTFYGSVSSLGAALLR